MHEGDSLSGRIMNSGVSLENEDDNENFESQSMVVVRGDGDTFRSALDEQFGLRATRAE
jgi:hypothetical protein